MLCIMNCMQVGASGMASHFYHFFFFSFLGRLERPTMTRRFYLLIFLPTWYFYSEATKSRIGTM